MKYDHTSFKKKSVHKIVFVYLSSYLGELEFMPPFPWYSCPWMVFHGGDFLKQKLIFLFN